MKDDDIDAKFAPVTGADMSDENPFFLANLLRALQREMRDGFESLREEMRRDRKQRELRDEQADYRFTDLEQRIAAQEQPKRKVRK